MENAALREQLWELARSEKEMQQKLTKPEKVPQATLKQQKPLPPQPFSPPGPQIKVCTTDVSILSETALSQAIVNAAYRGHFDNIDAPAALQQKSRWINVTIANETQFNLAFSNESWFYAGFFWTAPGNTSAFNHSNFSGCNTYMWITKVSGAAKFEIEIPGEDNIPISISFSNPYLEGLKTRAEFTDDIWGTWDRMVDSSIYCCTKDWGKHKTTDGEVAKVSFKLTSTPGRNAKVTIKQIIEYK